MVFSFFRLGDCCVSKLPSILSPLSSSWKTFKGLSARRRLNIATAAKVIASTMDRDRDPSQNQNQNPLKASQQLDISSALPRPVILYDGEPIQQFNPKRVLVLTKITRYEFEREKYAQLTEQDLAKELRRKGSDYEALKELHEYHKSQADSIVRALRERGIETHLVNRYEYGPEAIDWADAIVSAGGDGTFLLGASKLKNLRKPLIGINTDPRRSEGYLCLSKAASTDFSQSLDKLLNGQFRWFYRQRIRIELFGPSAMEAPVELHEQELNFPEHRFADWVLEESAEAPSSPVSATGAPFTGNLTRDASSTTSTSSAKNVRRVLPEIALNEVFIGESLSSRVSYYEISINDSPPMKQKSSGVTICTGTGSTSWSFNINKLTEQATSSIIRIIRETSGLPVPTDENYSRLLTKRFNDELIFDPSDTRMVYTVRDPVSNSIYSTDSPRGFAHKVVIKSRCFDASLVIDGGPSYKFNDGSEAVLSINPNDALRTVQLL